MDIEKIMPEEVNNTNILISEGETLNQRRFERFGQSDVLPQEDYMKIKTNALEDRQLIEPELPRRLLRLLGFGQSDVLPQEDYIKTNALEDRQLIEPELRRRRRLRLFEWFEQSDVLPQEDYMKIKTNALEYPQLTEQFGQSGVLFEPELLWPLFERFRQSHVRPQAYMKIKTKTDALEDWQLFESELRRRLFELFEQPDVLPQDDMNIKIDVQDPRIIREVALGFTDFLTFIMRSVYLIPGHYCRALYILTFCVVRYQAQALITQSASKLGTQSLLSMGEAFTEFFLQIIQMMTIMLCYLIMLCLVCSLDPVIQISIILLLIVAPCYYIPQVLGMASGIDVACGFFKVPLIWFTAPVALALALIFVCITLLVVYLIRRFIHPGNLNENQSNFIHPGDPSVEKLIEVSLDALSGENMV